jgi:SAM-dependent methyltransferase
VKDRSEFTAPEPRRHRDTLFESISHLLPLARRFLSRENRERHREERFFERLFQEMMADPLIRQRIDAILSVTEHDPILAASDYEAERDLPGSPRFQESGWWVQMLTRYALGMHYGRGKLVLDSCSGLGWGAYLLDSVARRVVAVELDRAAIELSGEFWPTTRTHRVRGSALDLCLPDQSHDVALAMESIEHFSQSDIRRYLDELQRVLKPGGMLVGSSAFPRTLEQAETLCARNPWHLHICTRSEMEALLKERFGSWSIAFNGLFFWARK